MEKNQERRLVLLHREEIYEIQTIVIIVILFVPINRKDLKEIQVIYVYNKNDGHNN